MSNVKPRTTCPECHGPMVTMGGEPLPFMCLLCWSRLPLDAKRAKYGISSKRTYGPLTALRGLVS